MIRYSQSTGKLWQDESAVCLGCGYSGHAEAINDPDEQDIHDMGPIPRGAYAICAPLDPPNHLGPLALELIPMPSTETFGRSGFYIHGDNSQGNRSASHGCIILPHNVRQAIVDSGEIALLVVL